MNRSTLQQTVGQLVADRPSRSRVFEQYGIDYCCGGKKPLAQACADRGLDAAVVLGDLAAADRAGDAGRSWAGASLAELTEHLVATHHAYLWQELPRLTALAERVAARHGAQHPAYLELRELFGRFRAELEVHLRREEEGLFPTCRHLDEHDVPTTDTVASLERALRLLEYDHDEAGAALSQIRTLAGGFIPPPGACTAQRALLARLADLESDLHRHVHLENHVLFPRLVALARQARKAWHTTCSDATPLA